MAVPDYLPEFEDIWIETGYDPLAFFHRLLALGYMDQQTHDYEIAWYTGEPITWQPSEPRSPTIDEIAASHGWVTDEQKQEHVSEISQELARAAVGQSVSSYFAEAFKEALKALWNWTIDKLKALIDLIVKTLKPVLESAWEFAKAKLEETGRTMYDGIMKLFDGSNPITPQSAPALAIKLYMFAMGAGMAAHGVAAVTELLHPLKRIGLHQTAAAIGDFASFSRIAGATIGPLYGRVLQTAMTYAVQNRYRPQIPDPRLLIEFRAKREIDKAQFDEAMGYQGYPKDWIDIIERWQWKDPRMFEIIRLADVGLEQGPPPSSEMPWLQRFGITGDRLKDWWLYRKFMRAGYEDVDLDVMVNFIHRREVAFALTYVRTAIRRNYRWGYLTDEELDKWMERLNLPEQAKQWIRWAGDLDRDYFYKQDLVAYYKLAFKNDVIDADELLISLIAMSMPARDAEIIVRTEKLKKAPKPTQTVTPEAKEVTTEYQKEYVTLYTQQYRQDLIGEDMFRYALVAVGLTPELADVTVAIEAAKKGIAI